MDIRKKIRDITNKIPMKCKSTILSLLLFIISIIVVFSPLLFGWFLYDLIGASTFWGTFTIILSLILFLGGPQIFFILVYIYALLAIFSDIRKI